MNNELNNNDKNQEPVPLKKPVSAVANLIALFRTVATPVDTSKAVNDLIDLNKTQMVLPVILLISGEINIHCVSDELLFATTDGPSIFGLQGSAFRFDIYRFSATQGSEIYVLTRDQAIDLVAEQGAIRDLLEYQTYFNDYQSERSNLLINKTAYEIVRALLIELYKVPKEKRLKISVANYILERSNLARSGVMKILADLRSGEYIVIQNGKLISLQRKLPNVY